MAQIDLGKIKFKWRGAYNGATSYVVDDVVESSGSSYVCIAATTGNAPPNATYWELMANKGVDADLFSISGTVQGDIYYNNGSAIARLAPGTSGQFLKTQGSSANPLWADAGGGLQSIQSFTSSGSYTWTKPAGITKVKVIVTGAGGGGMQSAGGETAGGGGGGTAIKIVDVSSISSVSVTVGAGAVGSTSASSPSGQGGTSSFGSHCSATGGTSGSQSTAPAGGVAYSGGEGGVGSNGDINLHGGTSFRTGSLNMQAPGGDSFWGGGGRGSDGGTNINGYNGGGGGNSYGSGSGTGGNGVVYVEEYK